MKDNEYKCDMCGGVFEKSWSDKEAAKELEDVWGGKFEPDDCGVVCDDCYKEFMQSPPPDAKVENCHFAQQKKV